MNLKTLRNTTIARVSFFTHARVANRIDDFDPLAVPGSGVPRASSLVRFSSRKDLQGGAAGSVSITLKSRKESPDVFGRRGKLWTDLLNQGDWWLIEILKNDQRYTLSFGVIDTIQYGTTAGSSGASQGTVTISGRDFGFALEDTPVFFNPWDPSIDNAAGVNMSQVLSACNGSPGDVVKAIIRGFMGVAAGTPPPGAWGYIEVPAGLVAVPATPWGVALNDSTVQPALRGGTLLTSLLTPESSGSVWDLVRSWCNPVMNEVFLDVSPVSQPSGLPRANLIVREKPFENLFQAQSSPWFRLTSWEIDARLCDSINLAIGNNRINYVLLTGDLKPVLQDNGLPTYPPVVNSNSIRRYGLKRLEESTIYFDGDALLTSPQQPLVSGYREWLFNLLSWNLLNHRYWQGSISTPELRGEIRVGEKVVLRNAHMARLPGFPSDFQQPTFDTSFYVEAVDHTYVAGERPTMNTTLTVSRGFQDALRVIEMGKEAADWTVTSTTPAPSADVAQKLGVLSLVEQAQIEAIAFKPPEPPTGTVIE